MILKIKSKLILTVLSFVLLTFSAGLFRQHKTISPQANSRPKLYWFIPDGFRADPHQFSLYDWAEKGEMPNLKKMMDNGCRGYSRPVFPGHTPTNFATLMTGVNPAVHGINDGSMRIVGYPLDMIVKGGFSSFSKLVPPLWVQMEKQGSLVSLQSIPGSTPPELFEGNTIKGRWGAWGIDFPSIIFQDKKSGPLPQDMGQNKRLFFYGSELTKFSDTQKGDQWKLQKNSFFDGYEVDLSNWEHKLYAFVFKSHPEQKNYDRVLLSSNRQDILADLTVSDWSEWLPASLKYELKNDYQKNSPKKSAAERELSTVEVDTYLKVKVIRLGNKGEFRLRIIYDNLNEFITSPSEIAEDMRADVGHMVDFVDNYPPQLIFFQEDKKTFLEEADFSWQWHKRAVPYLINKLKSDVVLQSIYSPNQMLTSRWWMPFIDKTSYRYNEKSEEERKVLWDDVKSMYRQADDILGEIMKNTDENWTIVLSSDHGAVPLYREIRLNNLFHQRGWLKYSFNPVTKEHEINWAETKVIYLQMNNIYINPQGLGGTYKRANSPDYYRLRQEVIDLLKSLKDDNQVAVTSRIWKHEEAASSGLHNERIGDLVIANTSQYNWSEDLSSDGLIFAGTHKGGYKQGIWPESDEGMLTPFVIMGPNIKKGCVLEKPLTHVDQFATIGHIFGLKPTYKTQGKILQEIFED